MANISKQTERIKRKIARYKSALAADKRRWGGQYDDSSGLRYIIPELYIQIQDWNGARKYFKWFEKNFPDDSCYPIFLFEWTITFFKTGDLKGAERKAFQTFFSNVHLFEKYCGKKLFLLDTNVGSNWQSAEMVQELPYSKDQPELFDFTEWLNQFLSSEIYIKTVKDFCKMEKLLQVEPVGEARSLLVQNRREFIDSFTKDV